MEEITETIMVEEAKESISEETKESKDNNSSSEHRLFKCREAVGNNFLVPNYNNEKNIYNQDPSCLVIYTGGTIGMTRSPEGYHPGKGYLLDKISQMREVFEDPSLPAFDILEFDKLLDSSSMGPTDWYKIANIIGDHYESYDSFIVLHGTDTMAYTASAMSYILEHLNKLVIFTGAMIPLCEVRSDARENLIGALQVVMLYSRELAAEVGIFFHGRLMRANRVIK